MPVKLTRSCSSAAHSVFVAGVTVESSGQVGLAVRFALLMPKVFLVKGNHAASVRAPSRQATRALLGL